MKLLAFTDERILNTINQSYNFDIEIVNEAKEEALKRGLISLLKINYLLSKNEEVRKIKQKEKHESDSLLTKDETLLSEVLKRSFFLIKRKSDENNALRSFDISRKRRFKRK